MAALKASWGTSPCSDGRGLKPTRSILEKHTNHFIMFMSSIVIFLVSLLLISMPSLVPSYPSIHFFIFYFCTWDKSYEEHREISICTCRLPPPDSKYFVLKFEYSQKKFSACELSIYWFTFKVAVWYRRRNAGGLYVQVCILPPRYQGLTCLILGVSIRHFLPPQYWVEPIHLILNAVFVNAYQWPFSWHPLPPSLPFNLLCPSLHPLILP